METLFATSADGTRIAYDVTGEGETIMLLHGGGQDRSMWHEAGYVAALNQDNFKVITMDIRGNGASDKPTDATAYTTENMCNDILAVADAAGVERFCIWGFSYGGNIARYLAAESARVSKLIIIGIPFGLGASGEFRGFIEGFRSHWTPIVQAFNEDKLDKDLLSEEDQRLLSSGSVPLRLAWLGAILDWRSIEPADLRCPTLWLIGSKNQGAMDSLNTYKALLKSSRVEAQVIDGLNHMDEFSKVDRVMPVMIAFMKS
jgi:pimeloyl-ACP methyl ester carboxylesterase